MFGVISIFAFWVSTPLILTSTFAAFVLRGEEMTAEKAFTTILLFNILQYPIRALPDSIVQLTQIWVSLKRIGRFLYTDEIKSDYIMNETGSDNAIEIRDGSFYWDLEKKKDEDAKESKEDKKPSAEKNKTVSQEKESRLNASDVGSLSDMLSESDLKQSLLSDAEHEGVPREPHMKALKRINLDIKRGKLTMVLGDIGSGKSSLLYSILA